MAETDTAARLRGLITEYAGVDGEKITDEAHLYDDLDLDSLDKVEVAMAAEEHFGIDLGDDQIKETETFAQFVDLIDRHR